MNAASDTAAAARASVTTTTSTTSASAASATAPAAPSTRRKTSWLAALNEAVNPTEGARRALIVGRVIIGIVTVGLIALAGRVAQLQVVPPPQIERLVDSQKSRAPLLGRRGTIADRHGRPLAIARPATRLFVDPAAAVDQGAFSEHVGYGLGYDPAWVEQRIAPRMNSRYVVLDRRLDNRRSDLVRVMKLPGLGTETYLVRDYPQGTLAGQLIGFVNVDGRGLEGMEKIFDAELQGRSGSIGFLRDAQRRPLWVESNSYTPPADGRSVRLSLDLIIQSIAETELAAACREFHAEAGQIIVMDPYTGEILALANYPPLDPNDFGTTPPAKRRNRAVTDTYEPGSTFKPFVWAVAMEGNFVRPNESIDCTLSGFYRFASGRTLRDAHPNGTLTGDGVLLKSSNIGMGKIGERMGKERVYEAVRRFGFGESTKSGLPGEVRGRVWPLNKWSGYSLTSVTMGQEVAVTAMQMTRAFSAFANGGLLVSPTIRMREESETPIFERVLQPATAAHSRDVLRRVVTEGTGRKADSKLYEIFGKTGTAQIAGPRGGYIPDAYIGSFVCGAPVNAPRVVVTCAIHRPKKSIGYYGGTVAAPAAKRVVEQTLVYMGVTPMPQEPANGSHLVHARR